MAKVQTIESALFAWAPKELAAGWDNVGLLVGDPEQEVKKVHPRTRMRARTVGIIRFIKLIIISSLSLLF